MAESGGTSPQGPGNFLDPKPKSCLKAHINNLWSIWYGISVTTLQAYIAVKSAKLLLDYKELSWGTMGVPTLEIHTSLTLIGVAVIALPLFLTATIFKVANLANDGYKIGRNFSICGIDPSDNLAVNTTSGIRALWRHGGPTAPFLHIVIAFCLLIPKLLMQAKLIQANFLPKEYVWKTDLDCILSSYDRLVVLSFTTSPSENSTWVPTVTPRSFSTSFPQSLKFTAKDIENNEEKWGPVSIEFFNYLLALSVYSVRYPAVFWNTNKCWGLIFSFQLFVNSIHNILIYIGCSILYKIHVVGPSEVLPSLSEKLGNSLFLLNPEVTIALLAFTTALVIASSLVLYLYGYGRFHAFLSHERACKVITVEGREWGYITHCTALCVLIAIAVVEGPLLVDLTIIYRTSLDTSVLCSVIGSVFHLFIWVVVWLGLTLKQNWTFKLRVTVGKAVVRSARSIKLLTDVELLSNCEASAPLLVVASGRTYTVCDTSPKRAIINAIQKAAMDRKARMQAGSADSKEQSEDSEDQIYWLRPKPISPKNSPDSEISERVSWYRKPQVKYKVTFDQSTKKQTSSRNIQYDDGDYARLRELPGGQAKQLAKVPEPGVLSHAKDYEDPSPLLTPEPPELPPPPKPLMSETPLQGTPRCLRRGDSGMPSDLTPRTESEASNSPPEHSETSSGIHSNSSRESNPTGQTTVILNGHNEVVYKQPNVNWKSTIQRNVTVGERQEVIIRRRVIAAENPPGSPQEQFGRSTNMRMTSFTDGQTSATLPHFPTQQVGTSQTHCQTMPLPPVMPPIPMQPQIRQHHTTIPTHHNGVRLFSQSTYLKKPFLQRYTPHTSFPHYVNANKITLGGDIHENNYSTTNGGHPELN